MIQWPGVCYYHAVAFCAVDDLCGKGGGGGMMVPGG